MDQSTQSQGCTFRLELQVIHLDSPGKRYLVAVTTVHVSATVYRAVASKIPGAAAAKADARKTPEYRSRLML